MPAMPPPSWHPDPDRPGQLRWWNGSAWTEDRSPDPNHHAVTPQPPGAPVEAKAPEWGAVSVQKSAQSVAGSKPWFKRWWGVTAIIFAILMVIGIAAGGSESSDPVAADEPTAAVTKPVETVSAEQAAADKAEKEAEAAEAAAAEKEEAKQAAAREKARIKAEKAKTDPSTYEQVSARGWSLIVKDPEAHIGKKIVLYGNITQFDSATGTSAFLADTASEQKSEWYDYDENTLVQAAEDGLFSEVVEDDLVKMYVEVIGSESYDTQMGGNTTVPSVTAHIIEVTGSSA